MNYLHDVFTFNFGTDLLQFPASVTSLLGETIPWTLALVGTATVIAFLARHRARHHRRLAARRLARPRCCPALMFLQAIPYFFLALVLIELVAERVHLFPTGQGYDGGLIPGWNAVLHRQRRSTTRCCPR